MIGKKLAVLPISMFPRFFDHAGAACVDINKNTKQNDTDERESVVSQDEEHVYIFVFEIVLLKSKINY